jgi:hypothetical protein
VNITGPENQTMTYSLRKAIRDVRGVNREIAFADRTELKYWCARLDSSQHKAE